MQLSANKKTFFFTAVLIVIAVNVIIQSFVTEERTIHVSEEESTLAKIRAMRQELHDLQAAEHLLKVDPANFNHPAVLSSLQINAPEVSHDTLENLQLLGEDEEKSSAVLDPDHPPKVAVIPEPLSQPPKQPRPASPVPPPRDSPRGKHNDAPATPGTAQVTRPSHDLLSSLAPPSSVTTDNILVVGGTDGSGTRRVVQLLSRLGVTVVSEDPETYDIHADLFGGWPNVVTPVLTASGSIVADPKTYPKRLQNDISGSLKRLILKATTDAKKPQSFRLAVGGALDKPAGTHAKRVKFAFKAPVAMTLVPWWLQATDKLMFLHVIRDGRDIAFSANQGPVNKFYAPMYGKRINEVPTGAVPGKAIKLWADWNNGLQMWARAKMTAVGSETSLLGETSQQFDYLPVHIENLVDSSGDVRLDAIVRIANFVGSNLDDDSLCCLAVEGASFMGSHDRAGKIGAAGESTLKSKYGKWKAKVKADPNLEKLLLQWGKEALDDLGYLHMEEATAQTIKDFKKRMTGKYQCSLSKIQCTAKAQGVKEWREAELQRYTPADAVASLCLFQDGVDFRGGKKMAVDISSVTVTSPDECCKHCRSTSECKFFTYVQRDKICYLKRRRGTEIADETTYGLISGATL